MEYHYFWHSPVYPWAFHRGGAHSPEHNLLSRVIATGYTPSAGPGVQLSPNTGPLCSLSLTYPIRAGLGMQLNFWFSFFVVGCRSSPPGLQVSLNCWFPHFALTWRSGALRCMNLWVGFENVFLVDW